MALLLVDQGLHKEEQQEELVVGGEQEVCPAGERKLQVLLVGMK